MEDVPGRLLFVDDDVALLKLFAVMLKDQPWEAHFCSSVDEALEFLGRHRVDTVISDIRMPGRDGFELLQAIREAEATRQVPVVILTGDSDRDLKRKALDLGATDLLNKPIGKEDLFARIRSALRLQFYQVQLAGQVESLDRRVKERTLQLEASNREVVWRLAKAAEYRDDETGNHVVRVALFSRILAEGVGLDREALDLILLTSPLHDIGKLGIPDSILLKEGRLNPQERHLMEQHCAMGAEILSQEPKAFAASNLVGNGFLPLLGEFVGNPLLEMASSIALGHHERWDGSGYPQGLVGERIPQECRIVAVADVFDALTSWRPYKPPLPEEEAVTIMVGGSSKHFDPAIVQVFTERIDALFSIIRQFRESETYGSFGIDRSCQ